MLLLIYVSATVVDYRCKCSFSLAIIEVVSVYGWHMYVYLGKHAAGAKR